MDIDRVAIIGAGPCGLAAAKYMVAERKFKTITVFEQRDQPGGIWNYTGDEGTGGSIPNTTSQKEAVDGAFASPVYDLLETNIPNSLMQYCEAPFPSGTALFPTHYVVKEYLHRYAEELRPLIRFHSQVLDISLSSPKPEWTVTWHDIKSDIVSTAQFDGVVVANGHYNEPNIPAIPGLEEWNRQYPGSIRHSSVYRRAGPFANKKVIVVGHSASGIDIAAQISAVSKHPLLISERASKAPLALQQEKTSKLVPEITTLNPQTKTVSFADNQTEKDVDHIVFCTGYHFTTPFLSSLNPPIVSEKARSRPDNLFKHVFYTHEPTIAFIGTPQRIVPFPFSQAQSAWVARAFAGRVSLPSYTEMAQWITDWMDAQGGSNSLAFPLDAEYINSLYEISMSATRRDGLENDRRGKEPPFWGERERWMRGRFPDIKKASQMLGERRRDVTTLEELGFYFKKAHL